MESRLGKSRFEETIVRPAVRGAGVASEWDRETRPAGRGLTPALLNFSPEPQGAPSFSVYDVYCATPDVNPQP